MSEMEKKNMQDTLAEADLEYAAGGKTYIVQQNKMMFCPYCKEAHNVSLLRGKHLVGSNKLSLYRCNRHELLFAETPEGYFNEKGDMIMYSMLKNTLA
jgi:hypothetical protein